LKAVLFIALGGAFGAVIRYAVSGWVQLRASGTFPWGTLAVNVVGCLLMGLLAPLMLERARPEYRMLVLVGVLGAFTTFSTFGFETLERLNNGQLGQAAGYVLASNVFCLSAAWVGYRLSLWFIS
jgi:CrcB protein